MRLRVFVCVNLLNLFVVLDLFSSFYQCTSLLGTRLRLHLRTFDLLLPVLFCTLYPSYYLLWSKLSTICCHCHRLVNGRKWNLSLLSYILRYIFHATDRLSLSSVWFYCWYKICNHLCIVCNLNITTWDPYKCFNLTMRVMIFSDWSIY